MYMCEHLHSISDLYKCFCKNRVSTDAGYIKISGVIFTRFIFAREKWQNSATHNACLVIFVKLITFHKRT